VIEMFVFVKRHAFKNRHHKMMVMTDDITHEDKVKCEQPLVEFTDRISTFMATMGSTDAAKLDIKLATQEPIACNPYRMLLHEKRSDSTWYC
jgi:hypothetical protein